MQSQCRQDPQTGLVYNVAGDRRCAAPGACAPVKIAHALTGAQAATLAACRRFFHGRFDARKT